MPPPPPPPPPHAPVGSAPSRAHPRPRKAVTFCSHRDPDARYHSDPGRPEDSAPARPAHASIGAEQRYYSEPDVEYFEIDFEFLKELRMIARRNCPKCERRKPTRRTRAKSRGSPGRTSSEDRCALCNGRSRDELRHCRLCCRICNRSTDTLDSIDDEHSAASRAYGGASGARSKSTPTRRKSSVQSNKSVSFLESSSESMKDEPNYTAKSFTNDLKRFLLKPAAPRLSLRDKFMIGFKQELEATKRSPKLKAIKGLWKSY